MQRLTWVDRRGREELVAAAPARPYAAVRLSPDGTRVALEIKDQANDIWMLNLARNTLTRVTTDPGLDLSPVWMPDGRRLLFSSQAGGVVGSLFLQAADGTGTAERLTESSRNIQRPTDVLADGARVLFTEGANIMMLTLAGDRRMSPVLQTPQTEQNGVVSPDGRWLAYDGNDSGWTQVFVRPFPNVNDGRTQVSAAAGAYPVWSRNGQELFYMAPNGALMSVSVDTGPTWAAKTPTRIGQGSYAIGLGVLGRRTYDVSPDGQAVPPAQAGGRREPIGASADRRRPELVGGIEASRAHRALTSALLASSPNPEPARDLVPAVMGPVETDDPGSSGFASLRLPTGA